MSRVQGRNGELLSNLSNTGIAEELESRLRELEKNIAVAREFIKLADESYSELRHKWNLLQEDARSKSDREKFDHTGSQRKVSKGSPARDESKTTDRTKTEDEETKSNDSSDLTSKNDTHGRHAKNPKPVRSPLEFTPDEDSTSPKKSSRGSKQRTKA